MQIPCPHRTQLEISEPSLESTTTKINTTTNYLYSTYKKEKKKKEKTLTLLQAEIGWWTIGWPANGNNGFGVLKDNGRNRVP